MDGRTTVGLPDQLKKMVKCESDKRAMGVTVVSGGSKEVAVYGFAGADAGQIGAGGCRRLLLDRNSVKERTMRAKVKNG